MNRTLLHAAAASALALGLGGCAAFGGDAGWTTLVDGARGLENFDRVGPEADWAAVDGAIQATRGGKDPSYLVPRQSYRDFEMRVEFWASDDANSGVFMRCRDPKAIGDETCYEANVFDQRPEWNTFELKAQGTRLVVVLNGQKTVDVNDPKRDAGPFALQWGRGTVKFRKVQIRPL